MQRNRWTVGPHVFELEADVLHAHVNGIVDLAEMKEVWRIIREEIAPNVNKIFYVLHLLSKAGGFTPEARKYAGTQSLEMFKAMIVVGGSPLARAAISIVSRAVELLGKAQGAPTKMFKTDEEANAYMEEYRAAEQAKAVQS